ncbi:MAG: hypothetical protein ABSE44_20540, partial [Candidatus Sulfotelmatobacter sp.]
MPRDFHRDALRNAGRKHIATGGASQVVEEPLNDASLLRGFRPGLPEIAHRLQLITAGVANYAAMEY